MSTNNVVSFTTPLGAAGTATSGPLNVARALNITGTIYSDQAGTAYVDQGGDGINWDYTTTIPVSAATGTQINVTVIDQWFQIRYVNNNVAQNTFRLYANPRDPYGAFLANSLPPSSGGAYGVLLWQPGASTYTYVGRFDGLDAFNAITNAALSQNASGKYAAFLVANTWVSDEVILKTTQHAPDAF